MKSYRINSFHYGLALLVMLVVLGIGIGGLKLLAAAPAVEMGFLLLVTAGGYFGLRKWAVQRLLVTLTAEGMLIRKADRIKGRILLLNQISSYLYEGFNDSQYVGFRLLSGEKVVLRHNEYFCGADDMAKFVKGFKKRLSFLAAQPGTGFLIEREKTFFEKPISDVVGWTLVAFLVCIGGDLLLHGFKAGKAGKLLLALSNALVYLATWWKARRARESNSG